MSADPEITRTSFMVGDWLVHPELHLIVRGKAKVSLEPKAIQLLLTLCRHAGRMVSKRELLDTVWADTFVTENVLTKTISDLRRAFGDDARNPRVIDTIPTRGYRLIASVKGFHEKKLSSLQLPSFVFLAGRQRAVVLSAFTTLLLLAGGVTLTRYNSGQAETESAGQRVHSMLIPEIDTVSEDGTSAEALRATLERHLAGSGPLKLLSRDRVDKALRLMRTSERARVDGALGRKVLAWDGNILALLAGSLPEWCEISILRLRLIDPADHRIVAAREIEIRSSLKADFPSGEVEMNPPQTELNQAENTVGLIAWRCIKEEALVLRP